MGQGSRGVEHLPGAGRPSARWVQPPPTSCSLALSADVAVVRRARRLVEDLCRATHVDEDTCQTAVLLVSETVTNAVVHARGDASLSVTTDAGVVRVEVGDADSRRPRAGEADPQSLDGRGLQIVRLLARRWGVRATDPGKVVWFEVGTPLGA